jgi:CSLREA domain-containing protein
MTRGTLQTSRRASALLAQALAAIAFAAAVLSQPPAHAAPAGLSLVVNNTADLPDPDASHPVCATASTQCTLRAAVQDANFAGAPSTITVPAGTYVLTRPGYDDNALVGDLDIAHDLTIVGAGAGQTIVDGNGAVTGDRVFQVLSTAQNVSMSGLTVRNGMSLSSTVGAIGGGGLYIESTGYVTLTNLVVENSAGATGGAVYANFNPYGGSLALDKVTLRGNVATTAGGNGGGAYAHLPSSYSRLIVQDSQVYSNSADVYGGAFYVDGDAGASWTILGSELFSNTATYGGAIGNFVPLLLSASRVHDNRVSSDGGAIYAFAPLAIGLTTMQGNAAQRYGGAIADFQNHAYAGYLTFDRIAQSTLTGNYATYGGAVFHDGYLTAGSELVLLNSTVSGNTAGQLGGGVYVISAQASLANATLAGNLVHPPLGVPGLGAGLYITASSTFTAQNSLLAYNVVRYTVVTWHPDDCYSYGTTGSLAFNLIQTNTNCFITGPQTGNIIGQDPLLGPLAYNGGPTPTHALLPGSPAIDAGALAGCTYDTGFPLTTDQRGFHRPVKGSTSVRCDIGAYEFYPDALFLPLIRR